MRSRSEFEANLYELPSCVLPPSTYFVYLHTMDYAIVEGIVPRIVQESANALTSEVSRRNDEAARRAGRFWQRFQSNPETMLIEVPAGGWKVRIEPDQDGELQRGRVGVLSTLMMPNAPDYSGTPTVRTVRSVFQDGQRTSTSVEVDTPVECSCRRRATRFRRDACGIRTTPARMNSRFTSRAPRSAAAGRTRGSTSSSSATPACRANTAGSAGGDDGRLMVQDVSASGTAINGVPLAGRHAIRGRPDHRARARRER